MLVHCKLNSSCEDKRPRSEAIPLELHGYPLSNTNVHAFNQNISTVNSSLNLALLLPKSKSGELNEHR